MAYTQTSCLSTARTTHPAPHKTPLSRSPSSPGPRNGICVVLTSRRSSAAGSWRPFSPASNASHDTRERLGETETAYQPPTNTNQLWASRARCGVSAFRRRKWNARGKASASSGWARASDLACWSCPVVWLSRPCPEMVTKRHGSFGRRRYARTRGDLSGSDL